jgi:hypothetical protein
VLQHNARSRSMLPFAFDRCASPFDSADTAVRPRPILRQLATELQGERAAVTSVNLERPPPGPTLRIHWAAWNSRASCQ